MRYSSAANRDTKVCRSADVKMDDGARVSRAVKQVEGKRLMYRESVDNPPYLVQPKGQMDAPLEG